jgi:hypothetical protein
VQQTRAVDTTTGPTTAAVVVATEVATVVRTLTDTAAPIVAQRSGATTGATIVVTSEEATARNATNVEEEEEEVVVVVVVVVLATVMIAPTTAAKGMTGTAVSIDTLAARSEVAADTKDARSDVLLPPATNGIDTTAPVSASLAHLVILAPVRLFMVILLPAPMLAGTRTKVRQFRHALLGGVSGVSASVMLIS